MTSPIMNERQRIAIMNPCVDAEDCMDPQYKSYHLPWSIILTINSGFECIEFFEGMPVWHVSIARLSRHRDRILAVEEWPGTIRKQARELADYVLQGVGGSWQRDEIGETAFHRRRRLSDTEMVLLYTIRPNCPVFTHGEALKICCLKA